MKSGTLLTDAAMVPPNDQLKLEKMKIKSFLTGLAFIIVFFIAVKLLFSGGKHYYDLDQYKKTVDSPISGRVTRLISGKNFFGAQLGPDSNNYYAFTYYVERTPKQWLDNYPKDFISEGDSIYKKANNDTFHVVRDKSMWIYLLPKDSTHH